MHKCVREQHKKKTEIKPKVAVDTERNGALHVLVEDAEALGQLLLALAGLVLLEQPHHHHQELLEVNGTAACLSGQVQ